MYDLNLVKKNTHISLWSKFLCTTSARLTPSNHINHDGDEAHRKESEANHHLLRGIFSHWIILIGAVLEKFQMDVDKEVLNIRVWEETAGNISQKFHAVC